mgnify:FL=1
MSKLVSSKNILMNNKLLFMLLLSLAIYIKPTVFNVIFLAIFLTILVPNVYMKIGSLITIAYVLLIFLTGKYLPVLDMKNTIVYTVFTLLCSFGGLFVIRSRRQRNLNMVVMLTLCFFLGAAFMSGIYKKAFFESYSIIANKGLFQYPDHEKLIMDVNGREKDWESNRKIIQTIQKENKERGGILMPPRLHTVSDLYLYKAPLYLYPTGLGISCFSRKMFGHWIYYIQELDIINCNNIMAIENGLSGNLTNIIDDNYYKLTHEKVMYLKEKYGIKIFVTMKEYNGLKLIYKDQKYFVYAL